MYTYDDASVRYTAHLSPRVIRSSDGREVSATMQPKEQPRTAQPCAGELPRPLGLLLVAAAWGGFGFLFGWHWWALFLLAARSPAERRGCALHFVLHVSALVITGAGGWWCRSSRSTYVPCAANQSMTRVCLWSTQPLDYQAIYVMHFVSGGALLCMGVLDGLQLPGWTLRRQQPLTALYSPYSLAPAYALSLAACTLAVTLTWTVFVDWEDATVPRLGGILVLVIVVVGVLCAAMLNLAAPRCCAPAHSSPCTVPAVGV